MQRDNLCAAYMYCSDGPALSPNSDILQPEAELDDYPRHTRCTVSVHFKLFQPSMVG
jgi:hypothetical protein